jgi:hypothetical protein
VKINNERCKTRITVISPMIKWIVAANQRRKHVRLHRLNTECGSSHRRAKTSRSASWAFARPRPLNPLRMHRNRMATDSGNEQLRPSPSRKASDLSRALTCISNRRPDITTKAQDRRMMAADLGAIAVKARTEATIATGPTIAVRTVTGNPLPSAHTGI